jgi:hypothetical protein
MKATKERRITKRYPIRVLVNCLPGDTPIKRNGHANRGWEMWARDLADDGVGLKWSMAWSVGRCPHCLEGAAGRGKEKGREICQSISPADKLKQGQDIQLDGLVYDDDGSQPMRGTIRWVRSDKKGKSVEFGVYVTTPEHRDYFKALEA